MYILRLRSCTLMGAFVISPVPPLLIEELPTAGFLRSTGITPLPRYYEPLRHPLIVGRFPGCPGYTPYPLSPAFTPPPPPPPPLPPPFLGREGEAFSICSTPPCPRAAAPPPPEQPAASASLRRSVLPSPVARRLGLQS